MLSLLCTIFIRIISSYQNDLFLDLFLLCARDHSTKLYGPLSFILSLVNDHSIKVRGHSYSLIHSFLNCANVLFAIFKAVLPLYFVRYIQSSTSYHYILYTIFVDVLLLYFVRYIHGYMKS